MASKSPNRNWKTADWKASGQLKTLEKEQTDLLKSFSRNLNELEGYLTQNKTMAAEDAYRCFFETYDNLEDNRQQQRLLLKPKYFENFDNDTKLMLEEKSKVLRWVVDKVPDLRDIEDCRAIVDDYRKEILREYILLEDSVPIENELLKFEKKLKAENLSDSEKQILCNQTERLLENLVEIFAESLQIMKTEACPQAFANFSNGRSYYRNLIKQHGHNKDCGNQTSRVASTSGKNDAKQTVVFNDKDASNPTGEVVEISSQRSATNRSGKKLSVAQSRSSRQREFERMELEILIAKQEAEQQLRDQEIQIKNARDAMKLQEHELRLRQRDRELDNERKKAEAEEQQ